MAAPERVTRFVAALSCMLALAGTAMAESAKDSPEVAVRLTLESAKKRLRVDYTVSRPVKALTLVRVPNAARAKRWAALDPAFELIHKPGADLTDIIRRKDGRPFTQAAFHVPATYTVLPKDYAPIMPFSEGSLLIHSGRFQACPGDCPPEPARRPTWPMTVAAPDAAVILLDGERFEDRVQWRDDGPGTYVYVGAAGPLTGREAGNGRYRAVVDPALPESLRDRLDALFPRLMAFYAERLGALPNPPMVFASYDTGWDGPGAGAQGGALANGIFFHFYGPLDRTPAASANAVAWFFAHEAAHLYQFRREQRGDDDHAWVHEGAAEAFAAIALAHLNAIDRPYLRQRLDKARSECAAGLRQGALQDAAARNAGDLSYSCGLLMQLSVNAALQRVSGGDRDIIDLWTAYVDELGTAGTSNGRAYRRLIAEDGMDQTADLLGRIENGPVSSPSAILKRIRPDRSDGLGVAQ